MGKKRPIDSGEKDALGRTIRVGGDTAQRADAPPPPVGETDDSEPIELTDQEWAEVWNVVSELAPRVAKKWAHADADEIAGQAMLGIGSLRNRGDLFNDDSAMRAYLWVVCRNAAFQLHSEHASGIRSTRWKQARAALARATDGKRLSSTEVDELASTITVSGSRLPDGWQHWGSVASDFEDRDIPETGFEDAVIDALDREASDGVDPDLIDGIYNASKWQMTAKLFNGPEAEPGILSENTAIKVRKMMADIGGIEEALRTWEDEALDPDSNEWIENQRALFAPFGTVKKAGSPHFWPRWQEPSFDDQARVVETLRKVGANAEEAWSSAVADATYLVERTTRKVPEKPKRI